MTIDEWIDKRNEVQLLTESKSKAIADECWIRLGVANRHIDHVQNNVLPLTPSVQKEIGDCINETREWIEQ